MTRDASATHLLWTLTFDWEAFSAGLRASPRPGGRPDLLGWRAGRQDPRYSEALRAVVDEEVPDRAALERVQRSLGVEPSFRLAPARCGDRRYGWRAHLDGRFHRKLVADAREPLHPVARGVRLYLDLIHVHPFVDGNARCATIWMVWALARGGWPLPDMEAVVRLPKPPGDPRVPVLMARTLGA